MPAGEAAGAVARVAVVLEADLAGAAVRVAAARVEGPA